MSGTRRDMATWWIDEPVLMGSPNLSGRELERLWASGFSVIVCLLDLSEQTTGYDPPLAKAAGWEWQNIPIRDFGAPSLAQLHQFVELIRSSYERTVVVHCEGGTGRTGTMAAAHWIAKGLSVAGAIALVRQGRSRAVETPEQESALVEFASSLASDEVR